MNKTLGHPAAKHLQVVNRKQCKTEKEIQQNENSFECSREEPISKASQHEKDESIENDSPSSSQFYTNIVQIP